jgi:hypothetical protein
MNDNNKEFIERARADFSRVRFKAFVNSIWSLIQGQPNQLLSYEEIKEKLRVGGPIYRGVQTVQVEQIVGSLNRYHQFDRAFLPTQGETADRWQRVNLAFYNAISLPPVVLYKVGQVYFVVDGHHRVSVAREQGQIFIEAEVRECASKVNITPDLKLEDLELLSEKVTFIERTGIDRVRPEANIKLNIPDGFLRMLEHIAVHKFFMGIEQKRDINDEEAVADWYDNVYQPIVNVIHQSNIIEDFPGQTEGDLYLWVLDHQHYLAETNGLALMPPEEAARDYIKSQKDVDEEIE